MSEELEFEEEMLNEYLSPLKIDDKKSQVDVIGRHKTTTVQPPPLRDMKDVSKELNCKFMTAVCVCFSFAKVEKINLI